MDYFKTPRKKPSKKSFYKNYEFLVRGLAHNDCVNRLSFIMTDDGVLACNGFLGCNIKDSRQVKRLGRWLMRASREMKRVQHSSAKRKAKKKRDRALNPGF